MKDPMLLCHLPQKRSSSTGPSTSKLAWNIETSSNTEIHADQEKNDLPVAINLLKKQQNLYSS